MRNVFLAKVVLADRLIEDGQVTVENGVITYAGERLEESNSSAMPVFDNKNNYIWPGLIDTHIHGTGGFDIMDGTKESLSIIGKTLLSYGVTGYLATTITSSDEKLKTALSNIAGWKASKDEAELLGVHLEGPWINEKYHGAQKFEYINTPRVGDGHKVFDWLQGKLKLVTLAPELENASQIIKELHELGVIVSAGHTDATYQQMEDAVFYGLSQATHIYNAMRGFHHREPGVVGAALTLDSLYIELIADGLHVHPAACKLLVQAKGTEKVILVSDSMRATGRPDGTYMLGELQVSAKGGKATLENGQLAGSLLTLNKAVMNIMRYSGIPLHEAVNMASLNPAKRLGLEKEIGSIKVGKRANLVAVDRLGNVNKVWLDGKEVKSPQSSEDFNN